MKERKYFTENEKSQKDNYVMIFLRDNLPAAYEEIKKKWLDKKAWLNGDDIYFQYCAVKDVAELFAGNGGLAGIHYIQEHMYIDKHGLGEFAKVKITSLRSTLSKLRSLAYKK